MILRTVVLRARLSRLTESNTVAHSVHRATNERFKECMSRDIDMNLIIDYVSLDERVNCVSFAHREALKDVVYVRP